MAYSTEERLCREALYGAAAAPPHEQPHDATASAATNSSPPLAHPEPNALTNSRAQHTLALAAAGPLPPLPGHAPPHRPGIDDGVLSTVCGRAQARLVLSGMEQATALWAQPGATSKATPSKTQHHHSSSNTGRARGQSTTATAVASMAHHAGASTSSGSTGWGSGCPQASIRIVTHFGSGGGSGNSATWRRRHEGALERASKLVATTSVVRDNALEESQGGKGPYGVSLSCCWFWVENSSPSHCGVVRARCLHCCVSYSSIPSTFNCSLTGGVARRVARISPHHRPWQFTGRPISAETTGASKSVVRSMVHLAVIQGQRRGWSQQG